MLAAIRTVIVLWAAVTATAAASPSDLEKKLEDLTVAIGKEPARATLYVTRSGLHRRRGDVDAALADLEQAARIPGWEVQAHLLAAEMLLQLERYGQAERKADEALGRAPGEVRATTLKARALVGLGKPGPAVGFYRQALARSPAPGPDLYVECARAIAAQGAAKKGEAVKLLDDGMRRIGPVVSLQLPAIELELAARRWDGALARVAALEAASPAKELWLKRRGEILLQAGRRPEAREAFAAALAAIDAQPASVQQLPRTQALVRELREQLAAAGRRPARGAPPR